MDIELTTKFSSNEYFKYFSLKSKFVLKNIFTPLPKVPIMRSLKPFSSISYDITEVPKTLSNFSEFGVDS